MESRMKRGCFSFAVAAMAILTSGGLQTAFADGEKILPTPNTRNIAPLTVNRENDWLISPSVIAKSSPSPVLFNDWATTDVKYSVCGSDGDSEQNGKQEIETPAPNKGKIKGFDPRKRGSGISDDAVVFERFLDFSDDEGTQSAEPENENKPGTEWEVNSTFAQNRQQGVIAWNGKEEILILTTYERSLTGSSNAMLSVLPLPGPPKDIRRADPNSFLSAKKLIAEKAPRGSAVSFPRIEERKIGSHNIFVLEMDNIETFRQKVQGYVAAKYDNQAAALITPEAERVIERYFEKGFRYFAFDLTIVEREGAIKEAIAYRFESRFAYYPLVISQIGGKGHTMVDLVVFMPGHVKLGTKAVSEDDLLLVGNRTFEFSLEDLKSIDESFADLFEGYKTVREGNFIFDGTIDEFSDDFRLIKAH